jgi:dihydroorotate dehydrogenase (NAD+) catalytic subunit
MAENSSLPLRSPYLNTAGTFGFYPSRQLAILDGLGAFITNPISSRRRPVATDHTLIEFPGGVLIHTGQPNPGFPTCVKKYAIQWKRAHLPIWVHLFVENGRDLKHMLQSLEECEGVAAIEIDLSFSEDIHIWREILLSSSCKLMVVADVPLAGVNEPQLSILKEANVSAISMAPLRGSLPDASGRLVSGRLYGPGVFPHTLKMLEKLSLTGLPVIAAGGIFTKQQADTCLQAGATAVKFDLALWKGNPLVD